MTDNKPHIQLVIPADTASAMDEDMDRAVRNVLDPRHVLDKAPAFDIHADKLMPAVYKDFVKDCVYTWGGDFGSYMVGFLATHAAQLQSSVLLQTNPLKPDAWRIPNDFFMTVGDSGTAKSGIHKDLTRFSEQLNSTYMKEWKASIKDPKDAKDTFPRLAAVQHATPEGMLDQIETNGGFPLAVSNDEAFNWFATAGSHHGENATTSVFSLMLLLYDSREYHKRMRSKTYHIDMLRATLIMATVIKRFVGWKALKQFIDDGVAARFSFACRSRHNFVRKDANKTKPGAEKAFHEVLRQINGLKDMRFTVEHLKDVWLEWSNAKEEDLKNMTGHVVNGLVECSAKYELRVFSIAMMFEIYDYVAGGCKDHEFRQEIVDKSSVKELKYVKIKLENLKRAIKFHEGFLFDMQEFFYKTIQNTSEFSEELLFIASKLLSKYTPENNLIARDDLCGSSSVAVCRGTGAEVQERRKRFAQALLDANYVEAAHEQGRQFSNPRDDNHASVYRVKPEFFKKFEKDKEWFRSYYKEKTDEVKNAFARSAKTMFD